MSVESEFVEMFRSEIKIPLDIPNWYHLAFELFLRELVLGTLGEASGVRCCWWLIGFGGRRSVDLSVGCGKATGRSDTRPSS
jgi:hypothetical protein